MRASFAQNCAGCLAGAAAKLHDASRFVCRVGGVCEVCRGAGEVYATDGTGPWDCYVCGPSGQPTDQHLTDPPAVPCPLLIDPGFQDDRPLLSR